MPDINLVADFLLALIVFLYEAIHGYVMSVWDAIAKRPKSMMGKTIVITGGASGIGKEVAQMFANLGAKIALLDVNKDLNERTANEINENAGMAIPFAVDVTKPDQLRDVARKVQEHPNLGDPYLVLCNAGVLIPNKMLDQSDDDVFKTINVNLLGYFWTIRAFLPRMIENNDGHIAAISSVSGYFGNTGISAYSASKFGVRGLMESLEWELMDTGITGIKLTTVYPYFTYSPMLNGIVVKSRIFRPLTLERTAEVIVNAILLEKSEAYTTTPMSIWCNLLKATAPQRVKVACKRLVAVRAYVQQAKS